MNKVDRRYTSFSFNEKDLISMMSDWLISEGHTVPKGKVALINICMNGPRTPESEWLRMTIDSDVSEEK